MTINKNRYQEIIKSLKLGNPVAENDNILQEARVSTPTFEGVVNDKYDIVTGRKGAGKTAIFKIIGDQLKPIYFVKKSTIILSGVNSSGESIFDQFRDEFSTFDENKFENFWKLYFISLIYNRFIKNPEYKENLSDCKKEIEGFIQECNKAGIPSIPAQQDRIEIIRWVIHFFGRVKKVKATGGMDPANPNLLLFSTELELGEEETSVEERQSIYVHNVGAALKKVLDKAGLKIWIILDRLDEVFERYSIVEFTGLRGLLRAYRSFDIMEESDSFRIKIFLRDDIKEFLTDTHTFKKYHAKKKMLPLAAATHIFSKESPVLSWTQEEIEQLILYRLLLSDELKRFIGITVNTRDELEERLRSKEKRTEYWNRIFPEKIGNSTSLSWIYRRLKDSNGVVTPRSVIEC